MKRLLVGMLLLVAACGKDVTSATGATPSLTGAWSGTFGADALQLQLVDDAGALSGSGTVSSTASGATPVTVTGAFTSPATVTLQLSLAAAAPATMVGALSGDQIVGVLVTGALGTAVSLQRSAR